MAGGRPSTYSTDIADAICERLADGESLRAICSDDAMPCKAAVFRWLSERPEFADQYARAREEQAEALADELVAIADGPGGEDSAVLTARDRLRVDARKWVASKLKPKKYGDKIQSEISGPNGGPIPTTIQIVGVEPGQ